MVSDGTDDFFKFQAQAGDNVDVWITQPSGPSYKYFYLEDASGIPLASDNTNKSSNSVHFSDISIPEDGSYYIRVRQYNSVTGSYLISIELEEATFNDAI